MTSDQETKCHAIIHTATAAGAAAAAGMAQLPGADVPLLIGIEITMTVSLGGVFGINLDEIGSEGNCAGFFRLVCR
ncbi:MAG: hypothetical protein QM730_17445 [Anaerolineales bacterium]